MRSFAIRVLYERMATSFPALFVFVSEDRPVNTTTIYLSMVLSGSTNHGTIGVDGVGHGTFVEKAEKANKTTYDICERRYYSALPHKTLRPALLVFVLSRFDYPCGTRPNLQLPAMPLLRKSKEREPDYRYEVQYLPTQLQDINRHS